MTRVSPLAPSAFPALPAVSGLRIGAAAAEERYKGRNDLMLALMPASTSAAGVLTRSSTAAAPVEWCRKLLVAGRARALVVNAGNANAFTGAAGHAAVNTIARKTAKAVGCAQNRVYVASTGVIGQPLACERITKALPGLHDSLSGCAWQDAAQAIMTTDTFPKGAHEEVLIDRTPVMISGIAKGSGMIAPDMATMLAFVFTDARLPASVLQPLLRTANARSFNAITVDGDTSTNDTCLLFATGAGPRHPTISRSNDPRIRAFRKGLERVLADLAQQIVRDGEGATKFITIKVTGAKSEVSARRVGLSIGNSPLVKTAIAGEDPNWGRLVMAVGKSGEPVDQSCISIRIGGYPVAAAGQVDPEYHEPHVAAHMKGAEIDLAVDLGLGEAHATVWSCDLTHGYIDINADYRS